MGAIQEGPHRKGIEGINIGLVVEPRVRRGLFKKGVEFYPHGFRGGINPAVRGQCSVLVKRRLKAGQANAVRPFGMAGYAKPPLPVPFIPGYQPSRRSRRPAVFIVQPGEHPFLPRLVYTGADKGQVFIAQIFRGKPCTHMYMEAAEAHLLELPDLPR